MTGRCWYCTSPAVHWWNTLKVCTHHYWYLRGSDVYHLPGRSWS